MRIASRIKVSALVLGVCALLGGMAGPACAQTTAPSASNSLSPPPVRVATQAAPVASLPPLPVMDPKPAGTGNNLANVENKIPDSVQEVVKHLDKTTDEVTLDDLNSARQAVAKIEALIEIEKHLAELDKVRQERDKKFSFAGAIPASALQPPSSMSMSSSLGQQQPMAMPERVTEVSRIMGRNGHYSAVMKMSDDKAKTVQVGDHLSDGSKVVGITATEVECTRGNTHYSLRVKNVDTVFGNSL